MRNSPEYEAYLTVAKRRIMEECGLTLEDWKAESVWSGRTPATEHLWKETAEEAATRGFIELFEPPPVWIEGEGLCACKAVNPVPEHVLESLRRGVRPVGVNMRHPDVRRIMDRLRIRNFKWGDADSAAAAAPPIDSTAAGEPKEGRRA